MNTNDRTVVHANPIRYQQQNSEITEPKLPNYMNYLICFREFANTCLILIAWILLLGLLGTIIWVIIKHS
jgi:hypothetical protein